MRMLSLPCKDVANACVLGYLLQHVQSANPRVYKGRCALVKFGLDLALFDVDDADIAEDVASFGCPVPFRSDLSVEFRESLQKRLRIRVAQWFRNERGWADVHMSVWQAVEEAGDHAR